MEDITQYNQSAKGETLIKVWSKRPAFWNKECLIVEKDRLIYKEFFFIREIYSKTYHFDEIFSVSIHRSIIWSALHVRFKGYVKEKPVKISFLWHDDAQKAYDIINGLLIAYKSNLEVPEDRFKAASELERAGHKEVDYQL